MCFSLIGFVYGGWLIWVKIFIGELWRKSGDI